MCEICKGTGWYGDNGPGIKGNREYLPCECRSVQREEYQKEIVHMEGHDENNT